jgi:pimeloyl-ACP methyl ester carboxylesterase
MSSMTLDYDRSGRGDPLVLIHGLGSARTVWSLVMPSLAEAFDVVAVDLPGHGRSPWASDLPMNPRSIADSVVETLDAIRVERAHLAGNSLGGWIALELAAAHPDRVRSVTALAPAGMRDVPLGRVGLDFRLNRYLSIAVRPLLPLLLPNQHLRRIGFARNSPVWETWSLDTCREAAEAMATSRGYDAALNATLGRVADCTRDIPPSIPLAIVFGDTDRILPPSTSQSRRYLPAHARWLEWERCGHAIQLDHPTRVVALVKEMADLARPR